METMADFLVDHVESPFPANGPTLIEVAAMLRQSAETERAVAKVREWLVEPIGTAEQMSALLIAGLGLQEEYADIAAVVALKTIQDAREELAALLTPTGGTT